jgi:hypothetical protein
MWSKYGVNMDFCSSSGITLSIFAKPDYDAGYGSIITMVY